MTDRTATQAAVHLAQYERRLALYVNVCDGEVWKPVPQNDNRIRALCEECRLAVARPEPPAVKPSSNPENMTTIGGSLGIVDWLRRRRSK